MIDSDKKLLGMAAEVLLKDIEKVEGIEINPLNPKNISNTAVDEFCSRNFKKLFESHVF